MKERYERAVFVLLLITELQVRYSIFESTILELMALMHMAVVIR